MQYRYVHAHADISFIIFHSPQKGGGGGGFDRIPVTLFATGLLYRKCTVALCPVWNSNSHAAFIHAQLHINLNTYPQYNDNGYNIYLSLRQEYPSPCELSAETVTLVGQRVKGITLGVQIVKRKEWFERLGYDHPLYPIIAMCLQDNPHKRWEMEKVRKEMNTLKMSNKPPSKLVDLLKENEVLKANNLWLTDTYEEGFTKVG